MNKVTVLGVYEFVAFALCKKFLEVGFTVNGVHFPTERQHKIVKEKKLEIGRNANYTQLNYEQLNQCDQLLKESLVIISIYDYFSAGNNSKIDKILIYLERLVKNWNVDNKLAVALVMPMELLYKKAKLSHSKLIATLEQFESFCEQNDYVLQMLYLPTIYGPWQATNFYFNNLIKKNLLKKTNRKTPIPANEYMEDAIYIDDIAGTIVELIEKVENNKQQTFIFKSDLNNHWYKCAELLTNIDHYSKKNKENGKIELSFNETVVKHSRTIRAGLESQRETMRRLLLGD